MSRSHLSCSPESVEDSLAEAAELCVARGGKLTPLRRRVLTLLLQSPGPAKAYDLLERLGDRVAAKPPSVYRSLDFLLEMGLAHRIESLNAFVACGHWDHRHAAVFLICEACGTAGELHTEECMQALANAVREVSFQPKSAVVEVRGRCRDCSLAEASR